MSQKNTKKSSPDMAEVASGVLKDPNASKIQKVLAGSILAQSSTDKETGKDMESIASSVMRSKRYSDFTRSLAASVLSQSNKER